jgi:hypothetical protein
MLRIKPLVATLIGFAAAVCTTDIAKASTFGTADAGLALENTIPDLDLALLTYFVGFFPGSTLNYGGDISSTAFSDYLTGTYHGQSLNINYAGNLTAFPSGSITWTTTGSYGANNWIESGSAMFTFPTSTTFTETYSSSITVGTHTGSFALSIDGSDSPDVTYLDASGTTIADGQMRPTYPTVVDPDNPTPQELTSDDICAPGKVVGGLCTQAEEILSADVILEVTPDLIDAGTISVVPEPSYGLVLCLALGGLAAVRYTLRAKIT